MISLGIGVGLTKGSIAGGDSGGIVHSPSINFDFGSATQSQNLSVTRATTATVEDHLGQVNTVKSGELRFKGLRRVENLIRYSQNFTDAVWLSFALGTGTPPVVTPNNAVAPDGTMTASTVAFNSGGGSTSSDASFLRQGNAGNPIAIGSTYAYSIWIRANAPTKIGFRPYFLASGTYTVVDVTTTWQRVNVTAVASVAGGGPEVTLRQGGTMPGVGSTATVELWGAQVTLGPVLQDYVSIDVTSGPAYHGAYVDGVKYFNTDAAGSPIAESTREGILVEEARTNVLLNSDIIQTNLATQSVTVTAVPHTLSFYGTGTITLSGASTAGPLVGSGAFPTRSTLTFTPSAGSLTLTVTGTVQLAQLEIGSGASSFIPTAGSAVTRNADVVTLTYPGAFSTTQGTWVITYKRGNNDTATAFAGNDGASNNGGDIVGADFLGADYVRAYHNAGSTREIFKYSSFTYGQALKVGIAYTNGVSVISSANGVTGSSLGDPGASSYGTTANIGSAANGGSQLNNTIRSVKWYNTALTQTQLNALTA